MKTHEATAVVKTSTAPDIVDVTHEVMAAAHSVDMSNGYVTIALLGEGCAVVVNENESNLVEDMKAAVKRVSADGERKPGARPTILPLVDGQVQLGTWQRIMLIEMVEPSEREILVQIVGE